MRLLLFIFLFNLSYGQQVHKVITNHVYSSFFDTIYKQPLYVSYKVYQGGGDISRKHLDFKADKNHKTAKASDYSKSGFDKGHLADYQTFANDSVNGELTFRYYNCIPQYPNLNRGIWNEYERIVRQASQSDSLLVICGGSQYEKIGKLYVPNFCWKIVIRLHDNHGLYFLWFTNEKDSNIVTEFGSVSEMEEMVGFEVIVNKNK